MNNQTWTIKHELSRGSCLIVHIWLPLQYSLTFICLVSPMLPVSLDCSCLIVHVWLPLQYSLTFICLVSPMLPVSLDCSCLIAPSVFSETGNIGLTKKINVRENWRGNQTWTIKHEQIKRNWQQRAHKTNKR
jgi:hypothetical protein